VTSPREFIITRSQGKTWSVARWSALLVVLSFALIWFYGESERQLSLFDEWVHVDYLDKVTRWEAPNPGEAVDVYAMELSSCRGVIGYGQVGSPCGGPYERALEPYGGLTTGGIHGPSYFALTAAGAQGLMAMGVTSELLTAGRLVGGLWLGFGLVAFLLLARELGATRVAALGMGAVLAFLPITRWTNAFITPDAANLLAGSLVVWSILRWERGASGGLLAAVLSALATALKAQNLLVVVAAISFVLFRRFTRSGHRGAQRESRHVVVLMLLGATLPVLLWIGYQTYAAIGEFPDQGVGGPLTSSLLVQDTTSLLVPVIIGPSPQGASPAAQAAGWLMVAGGLGALVYRRWEERSTQLAASLLIVFVVGGPLLIISNYLINGVAVPSSARYGGALLPGLAAVAAASLRGALPLGWLTGTAAWLGLDVILDRLRV
jgi:hypothetical protein